MDCGYLIAPEDHDHPENGRTVRLPVAILHSKSENHFPDPLVYLSGGPGQNGIEPKEWLDFPIILPKSRIVVALPDSMGLHSIYHKRLTSHLTPVIKTVRLLEDC